MVFSAIRMFRHVNLNSFSEKLNNGGGEMTVWTNEKNGGELLKEGVKEIKYIQ
jgi:hypothetical protein